MIGGCYVVNGDRHDGLQLPRVHVCVCVCVCMSSVSM